MPITSGTTIGPYKVEREIGRGGMGVIFLATDTRLGRTVALKALPEDVASDPDRLQRFEREARVLASLNHPNVAAIYGLEEADGHRYLALELIEGETLADKLAHGPLPLSETLDICIQIASGMEAAHDAGVVHRDLKPANVMITPGDHVKVLDFGLAKGKVATDESGLAKSPALIDSPTLSSPTLAHSPTLVSPATMPGVILGTAAYLSPEQARGKMVDRRTDIWSFGCVLYECLTGGRPFEGETVSDTIAKILERDVDLSTLPKATPPRLRELLERCLEKDPKRRLRDIGDARITLEEIKSGRHAAPGASDAAGGATPAAQRRRTAVIAAASALAGAIVAIAAWNAFGPSARGGSALPTHLSVEIPTDIRGVEFASALGGRALVILGETRAGDKAQPVSRLYVRHLDRDSFESIPGTERATNFIVSADGRWLSFLAPPSGESSQLRVFKVPIDGQSPPAPIGDASVDANPKAAWLQSGEFILGTENGTKYFRVPKNGGAPGAAKKLDVPGFLGQLNPTSPALPGDRGVFLNAISYEGGVYRQGVGVLDLKSGRAWILIKDGGSAHYLSPGILLFSRQNALFAAPFDLNKLELRGEPVAILDGIYQPTNWINASFDLAPDGTLSYIPGGSGIRNRRLVVVDPDGKVSEWSGERQPLEYWISASPDGSRCTQAITNANAITEIWVSDRGRPSSYRLQTKPGADCLASTWSPDGSRIVYYQKSQSADDGLYISSVDGAAPPRRLAVKAPGPGFLAPFSWSPDGSTLLATLVDGTNVHAHSIVIPADPKATAEAKPLFRADIKSGLPTFSPSGRMVAYVSSEAGKYDVFVTRWDGGAPVGRPLPVSTGGGTLPHWSRDGKRLYYQTDQEKVMAAAIAVEPELRATAPVEVWDLEKLRIAHANLGAVMDILPGGRMLAVQRGEGEDTPTRIDVVLGFPAIVKQRMSAAGR